MSVWVRSIDQPTPAGLTLNGGGRDRDLWVSADVLSDDGMLLASTFDANVTKRLLLQGGSTTGNAYEPGSSRWSGSFSITVPSGADMAQLARRDVVRMVDLWLTERDPVTKVVQRAQIGHLIARSPRVDGRVLSFQLTGAEGRLDHAPDAVIPVGALDSTAPIDRLSALSAIRQLAHVGDVRTRQLGTAELGVSTGTIGGDDAEFGDDVLEAALGDGASVDRSPWQAIMEVAAPWGLVPYFDRHGVLMIDVPKPSEWKTGLSRNPRIIPRNVYDDNSAAVIGLQMSASVASSFRHESANPATGDPFAYTAAGGTVRNAMPAPYATDDLEVYNDAIDLSPTQKVRGVPTPFDQARWDATGGSSAIRSLWWTVEPSEFVEVTPMWPQTIDLRSFFVAESTKSGLPRDLFRADSVGWQWAQTGASPRLSIVGRRIRR